MASQERDDGVALVEDRETYRYLDFSYIHAHVDSTTESFPEARPSPDSALTAFIQLAVHRLNTRRAFVSLLDRRTQYVIAETTASAGLRRSAHEATEEGLIMCGIALPYSQGVSSHVLKAVAHSLSLVPPGSEAQWQLPVVIVPDVQDDNRFAGSRVLSKYSDVRFYAAVPIRSPAGPFVGVLALTDDKPRADIGTAEQDFLRDMSLTIMDHLMMIHRREEEARGRRMMRGLGSFVEGLATISSLAPNQGQSMTAGDKGKEGALNVAQQAKILNEDFQASRANGDVEAPPPYSNSSHAYSAPHSPTELSPLNVVRSSSMALEKRTTENYGESELIGSDAPEIVYSADQHPATPQPYADAIFSRAANIIRESIEVEGVLFFDASVATAGAAITSDDHENVHTAEHSQSSGGSSDEETAYSSGSGSDLVQPMRMCKILGFSTTETASINGHLPDANHLKVPERFLRLLLRRHTKGKIFNFDEHGITLSDTESDSDSSVSTTNDPAAPDTKPFKVQRHRQRAFTRSKEPSFIIKIFPDARSVIAFPLWDSHRLRWYAGGVAWTRNPTRVLSTKSELSYLRAFGATVMAEIARLDAQQADQAKADVLGSISHELRSPLHGILGSTELLQTTSLDVFQDSTIHTIERCGMTLLDTIDHLLDYAKVNNHLRAQKVEGRKKASRRGFGTLREARRKSTSSSSDVDVDSVVEDIIESMFAGHEFQTSSHNRYAASLDRLSIDTTRKTSGNGLRTDEVAPSPTALAQDQVKVILDIRPASSWKFSTQVGALRRIVMNIFGNALRYTAAGQIRVTLEQEERPNPTTRLVDVKITVEDTGRGISKEFLSHHLFTPFVQEDSMTPGTGLGLSITQKIVKSLGGTIRAQSKVGRGTVMSVSLPLFRCAEIPGALQRNSFVESVERINGLRVSLYGFEEAVTNTTPDDTTPEDTTPGTLWQLPRQEIAQQCQAWLKMVVLPSTEMDVKPDVYVATLAGAEALANLNKAGDVFQPIVVICPNAEVARHLSTTSSTLDKNGVFEYMAQPCGPRKLAGSFVLALDRWANVQVERASNTFVPLSQSPLGALHSEKLVDSDTTQDVPPSPRTSPSMPVIHDAGSNPPANPIQSAAEDPAATQAASRTSLSVLPTTTRRNLSPKPSPAPVKQTQACMPYLVVDDSAVNVRLLTTYLSRQNLPFASATDGALAVAAFKAAHGAFSCIFMDIQMPNLDGLSATRAIREYEKRERLQPVHIIVLTGLARLDVIEEAEASGANEVFPKPVRLKDLTPIVAEVKRPLAT